MRVLTNFTDFAMNGKKSPHIKSRILRILYKNNCEFSLLARCSIKIYLYTKKSYATHIRNDSTFPLLPVETESKIKLVLLDALSANLKCFLLHKYLLLFGQADFISRNSIRLLCNRTLNYKNKFNILFSSLEFPMEILCIVP